MNNSKIGRIICSIIILIIIISSVGMTYAASSSELNQQKKDIDNQIAQTNSEIANIKKDKSEALTQISNLNSEISSYENEIDDLQTKINSLNQEISVKEQNIVEQQQKYDQQKELLDKRLVAMYENGNTSYLDMLLSSDGLADFISKYYMIAQIAEFDEELLTDITNTKNQIEAEKNSLTESRNQIETSKNEIQGKQTSLASSRNKKQSLVNNLSAEEAELQKQLEEFEEDRRAIQRELAALASKSGVKVVEPSACGYGTPLAGKTKANITCGYHGYSTHTGVDFACAAGTPVMAVKDGTVVISTALRNPDGSYRSYGEYVAIDHHDGTDSMYCHMTSGSRTVSKNDTVKQGQVIGQVGSTGRSTGPHLHFEVRVGGKDQNPTKYLP